MNFKHITLALLLHVMLSNKTVAQSYTDSCLQYITPVCNNFSFTQSPPFSNQDNLAGVSCIVYHVKDAWFSLHVDNPGDLDIYITSASDVDAVIWGPFNDALTPCAGLLSNANLLACDYSGSTSAGLYLPTTLSGKYYILHVSNYGFSTSPIQVEFYGSATLDCSGGSSINYHTVIGQVFHDQNNNKVKDVNEQLLPQFQIDVAPLGTSVFTDYQGLYYYLTDTSQSYDYTVNYIGYPNWGLTTDSSSYHIHIDTNNVLLNYDFGVKPIDSITDYSLDFYMNENCGFQNTYWVNINNTGTTYPRGYMKVTFDALTFSPNVYEVSADSIIGHTVYFNVDSLGLFENRIYTLHSTSPGVAFVGDTLHYYVTFYETDTNGIVINTTSDSTYGVVSCSYDPNNKTVSPEGIDYQHFIDTTDILHYTINFQNTGNAPAENIVIIDSLSDALDITTFQYESSSHNVYILLDTILNYIRFSFNNIMLPDSNSNEPLSHGYVKFNIEQKPSLLPNTEIINGSDIYFDQNPAVSTNQVFNTIECYIAPEDPVLGINDSIIESGITDLTNQFSWYLNDSPIPGADSSTILVGQNGTYHLIVSNQYGCETQDTIELNCYFLPPTPLLTLVDTTLQSSITDLGYTYLWLLDGDTISGADKPSLEITNNGEYTLTISDAEGCLVSVTIVIDYLSSGEFVVSSIAVFPNPTENYFTILCEGEFTYRVFSVASGQIILIGSGNNSTSVDLSRFSAGNYLLEVTTSNGLINQKIVKN